MKDALFNSAWGPIALALTVGCLTMLAALAALGRPRLGVDQGAARRLRQATWLSRADADGERAWRSGGRTSSGSTARPRGSSDKTRAWDRLARKAERANVGWRPSETVAWSIAAAIGAALVRRRARAAGPSGRTRAGVVALVTPSLILAAQGRRAGCARSMSSLPDVLMTMAGALKVGQSFNNSMKAIVDDGEAPASEEFGRVLVGDATWPADGRVTPGDGREDRLRRSPLRPDVGDDPAAGRR